MPHNRPYLECEKAWIYRLLIVVAGFFGGYTMIVRGGVFSNAQTGNVVYMAVALGQGNWREAVYYLIPISAYMLGGLFSDALPKPIRRLRVRWDTMLVAFEILMVILMGFIPTSAPHQICQVIINFICAMQYNTFRSAEGVPMATTFVTNHIRQLGLALACIFTGKKTVRESLALAWVHIAMIICFIVGVTASTICCRFFGTHAIWFALPLLAIVFVDFLHADLTKEKALLSVSPDGH